MALLLALLLCGVPVEATAVPIDLRLIVTASAVQLDPAHEADARFFEGDRGCWKAGLRSARLTNACGRRPSAPLRKVIESPVQQRAQPGSQVFLRHISIMRLLATASVSGLLREQAHLRKARSRFLRCCPGATVIALGRPLHRARDGHDLLIRSSMCGHPDPFKTVRNLGRVHGGCSCQSSDPGKSFVCVAPSVAPRDKIHLAESDCCRPIRWREGIKGRFACTLPGSLPVPVAYGQIGP